MIPSFAERKRTAANSSLFRDVVRDRASILYDEFYSESIADMIHICAEAAKKSCGGNKLVGAYYGYHMEYGNLGYCLSGGGHNALYKLLQSPYVDFILSPQSYGTRTVGNPNSDMKPYTSVAKYNKFSMHEDDTRTHCTAYNGFCHSLNPDQTREVLRRNIGLQLSHKVPLNHLPLVGGNDLNDPAIRADFVKAMEAGQKLFERNLPRESEVAAVIDEQSAKYLAFSQQRGKSFLPWMYKFNKYGDLESPEHNVMLLMGELIYFQRIVLGQLGFPVDYILAEDAPEAAKKYKMLILLDCFKNNDNLQKTFANAKKSNCHILSVYGSGLLGKNGFDVKNMSKLLGMNIEIAPAGSLMVKYLDRNIGGEYKFEPRFRVVDNTAEVLAYYSDKGGVAAARKGNVTLYGGAQLDSEFVQNIAKCAGVHVYAAAGDNLEIGGGVLSFHAASRGKKVITLKKPCRLVEIFTGETVDATSGKVVLNMEALTTKVFSIEE